MAYYAQAESLGFFGFSMMMADKRHKAFGKTYESYAECAVVDYAFHTVVGAEYVGSVPQFAHDERELFGKCCFLKLESVA